MSGLTLHSRLCYAFGETPERELLPTAPTDGFIECRRSAFLVADSRRDLGNTIVELVTPTSHELLPRPIVVHSPTGFEWGYGGSGPADLAANVLAVFVSWKEAWRLHSHFLPLIAAIPEAGGRLPVASVRAALDDFWRRETDNPVQMLEERRDRACGGIP